MLKKDKGICIRAVDFSETSQILAFFTASIGKINVIAKGAKRPKSPFGGPVELLAVGDMVFSIKDGDKLATLTEFNQTFFGFAIRKKIFALNSAFFCCELLNSFTKEFDPHPVIFEQTVRLLQTLEEVADSSVLPHLILFQLVLLSEVGSKPLCEFCANCKRKFSADWQEFYFSLSANGFICRDCEPAFVDKRRLSWSCATNLNQPDKLLNCDTKSLIEIQKLLIEYEAYLLEKPLRTSAMILNLLKKTA